VLSPIGSARGKLLSQYVCVRITRMDDVDIGLFDRDWNNTLYYFILNADEQIYMRYGGRDPKSQDIYLNLSSLELALQQGLELHRRYQQGELKTIERPRPMFPREIPLLVERTFSRRACVECHLIGDFLNLQREQQGKLDKLAHLYRSPEITTLGIQLDVPKGLVVKEVRGSVEAAGMKSGDRIAQLDGTPIWTFGDLQYRLDKVPRDARQIRIGVERDGAALDLTIALPERWWWTDLTFRQSSVEPRVYFDSRPLSEAEKRENGLERGGFASKVTHVDMFAELTKSHQLRVGDIIFGVDGVERDEAANTAELFIKLRKTAGDTVTLGVIRDGKRMSMKLKTYRLSFRK
jgi:serine protease Do